MTGGGERPGAGVAVIGALAVYDVVQNLLLPERAYVPANLAAAAGLVIAGRAAGAGAGELGLAADRIGSGIAWGVGSAAALSVAGLAARRAGLLEPWLLDARGRGHAARAAAHRAMVRYPLGTALFEEVAFRGVLDGLWRGRGDRTARAVTAAAFGLWHLLPTYRLAPGMGPGAVGSSRVRRVGASVAAAVVTGIAGLGFTALRERSGSVVAPWILHAAANSGAYLLSRAAWRSRGGQAPARPIAASAPT